MIYVFPCIYRCQITGVSTPSLPSGLFSALPTKNDKMLFFSKKVYIPLSRNQKMFPKWQYPFVKNKTNDLYLIICQNHLVLTFRLWFLFFCRLLEVYCYISRGTFFLDMFLTLIRFSISEVGIFQFPLGLLSWKYLVLEISEITSASSLRVCLQLTRDCCVLEQAPAVKY